MHGSRSKIPSKKSRQAGSRGGFNSGGKGLIFVINHSMHFIEPHDSIRSEQFFFCLLL
jgi:hypothetical protein